MNKRPLVLFALLLVLPGCGGGGGAPTTVAQPEPQGLLRLVAGAAELERSLKAGVRDAPAADVLLAAAPAPAFSGTYTQELRVDELDAVRYDGTHLFVAPLRSASCCFIADPLAMPAGPIQPPAPVDRSIRILRTNAAQATATPVGRIPLEADVSVQGLYLDGTRVVALTSEAFYGTYGQFWTGLPYWAPTRFGLRIYDVADPAQGRMTFSATIDGVFVDSRRIGDRIYVISRFVPSAVLDPVKRADLANATLDSLLPRIRIDGNARPLVDPARCYVTRDDADSTGTAVLTSITVIPISNPSAFTSTCYNEEAYGAYVSEQAMYFLQYRAGRNGEATARTRIHRFDLGSAAPAYRGSAEVDGAAWVGGQADFRVSEHNGLLRLVTTEWLDDPLDNVDHRLYVLRPHASRPELEIVAQLPNSRRPEEIGKPNEQLYGVRFVAERAYMVTFRRIDPLYVLDLASTEDPRIAGALELPGFSEFLHPIGESLLLGLGEVDTGGVRVALFDVSAPGRPLELGGVTLGGRGSSSEAMYDRHAFAWLPNPAGVDRFAIPATLFSEDGRYRLEDSALHLFEIHNRATPALARLVANGRIVAGTAYVARSRAFIHGDAVFYVADEEVRAARWSSPGAVNGPF